MFFVGWFLLCPRGQVLHVVHVETTCHEHKLHNGGQTEQDAIQHKGLVRLEAREEGKEHDKVEGDPVEVVNGGALVFGDNGALHGSHDWPVHADADLKDVHGAKGGSGVWCQSSDGHGG